MSTLNATPAWPRRPPLWSSAALALSVLFGILYCWAAVKLLPGNQGRLFPVYAKSAAWSLVPQMPTLRKHSRVPTHTFVMPDSSVVQVPAKALYSNLRKVIYGGESVTDLLTGAFFWFGSTLFVLLLVGLVLDRTHEAESRNGRRLRGPRIVSRWRFNLETIGDGLRFPLTTKRNLVERLQGKAGFDLVLRRSKEAQHIQVSGDTGAGKSTIIRTILYQVEERGETAIVFDPEREYLKEFYSESRGDVVLNPKDDRCPYWAIGEEADDEPQATPIANGLFPEEPAQQKFFLNHTRAIFAYLLAYYKPTVNELGHWMAHPEEIDKRVKETEHAHTMTENAAPQRAGILGTLNEAGKPLRMMPTSHEARKKFTIREWARKRQGWIFVTSTSETIDALRPLQGLWLDMLILKLQADDTAEDAKRCWLVLDEVQELQRLPQLPKALTRQRKSDNPIVVGFQGMAQIDANYGKQAETMLSQPFYNFMLRTQESRASKHLSDRIGSVQLERVKESKPAFFFNRRHRTYTTERVIEPLVLPSEIQELEDLTGYFVASGKVVKIAFDVPPKRVLAPGLIERMIPNVQTRPLDPEPTTPAKAHTPATDDTATATAAAAAFD